MPLELPIQLLLELEANCLGQNVNELGFELSKTGQFRVHKFQITTLRKPKCSCCALHQIERAHRRTYLKMTSAVSMAHSVKVDIVCATILPRGY